MSKQVCSFQKPETWNNIEKGIIESTGIFLCTLTGSDYVAKHKCTKELCPLYQTWKLIEGYV